MHHSGISGSVVTVSDHSPNNVVVSTHVVSGDHCESDTHQSSDSSTTVITPGLSVSIIRLSTVSVVVEVTYTPSTYQW